MKKTNEIEKIIEKPVKQDFIGRDAFTNNILNIINKSKLEKSWTFAINGEWGAGKSYVLNMIGKELITNEHNFVVKYDAWANDFYHDPLIAIIYNVLDEIEKYNDSFFLDVAKGIRAGLLSFYDIIREFPVVKQVDNVSKKITKRIKNEINNKTTNITMEFLSYNNAIETLKKQLIKISKKKKLIILVDELDRCEPEYALTILNRLHNVFDVSNTVILIAVNERQMIQVINTKYGENAGIQYLEKFFDLTFNLNEKGKIDIRQKYAELLFLEYLEEKDLKPATFFLKIITSYLTQNARKVVKFFQKLRFLIKNIDDKNQKYDFLCLSAYLLLAKEKDNKIISKIQANRLSFGYKEDIIDLNYTPINIILNEQIINYYKSLLSNASYNGYNVPRTEDFEINRFLAMLNIIRHNNDKQIVRRVNEYFSVILEDSYLENINSLILLIDSLSF